MNNKHILLAALILLVTGSVIPVAGNAQQPSLEVFGQNRLQFRRFEWKFYQSDHFRVYYYDRAGRSLARYVAEQAEEDISAIERKAGGLFPDQISIMLYNSYDDFEQSNIGLNSHLQMQNNNPAGTIELIGDKLVVYFTGAHVDLKRQLRQGMAQVVMEHLMFGENFQQMVRNAVLMDLPDWFTSGYVAYIVDGWTAQDDNNWKNLVTQNKKLFFNDLTLRDPKLAGKAFWKYVTQVYGINKVKNLLYVTQLKGSLNKAIELSLAEKVRPVLDSVLNFYQNRYAREQQHFGVLDTTDALIKIHVPADGSAIRDIKVSPRGYDVAYVKWKEGEYKVIIERSQTDKDQEKKRATIVYGGVKNLNEYPDPDYPLLAWSNTGFKLGIIYKKYNSIRIRVYNSVEATMKDYVIPSRRFDRVTGFTFLQDDGTIMLSAIKNGQSDLFEMRLKGSRLTQITDDAWDDKAPVLVSGGSRKGIVFLSNRPQPYINIQPLPNELPTGLMNAFFYSTTTKSYKLLQLTHATKGNISQIIPYGSDHFAYLSDKSGVRNRYVVLFGRDIHNEDSAYSVPMTNYGRSIQYQNYNAASAKIGDVIQYKDDYYVYFNEITLPPPAGTATVTTPYPVSFVDGIREDKSQKAAPLPYLDKQEQNPETQTTPIELSSGDYFQSAFTPGDSTGRPKSSASNDTILTGPGLESTDLANLLEVATPSDSDTVPHVQSPTSKITNATIAAASSGASKPSIKKIYVDSTYLEMRSHRYYLSFRPDFVSLRLDNNVMFSRYQSYNQTAGQYQNPSLAGMLMVRLYDKMEDYRFTGGLRVPANFSGLAYFLKFENFRRRLDWGLMLYREEEKQGYNFAINGNLNAVVQIPGKTISNILQGEVAYPLDKVRSLHLYLGVRQDKMILKAQEPLGLLLPNVQDLWGMSRLEYVYDNTRNPALNIWNGLRYKLFGEYMYKLYTDNDVYYLSDTFNQINRGGFYNFGADFRYYQPIYKNIIWAIRLAGAHSGGREKILYYLGGMENAINGKFNDGLPPSSKNTYAFQALAQNLRGYDQNARNGNTYALLNAEIRFPIISTFAKRPIQSSILKNLQAVAFVDMGSAWEGLLPTEENTNRTYTRSWPPSAQTPGQSTPPIVQVQLPYTVDNGLAIGYGGGLRTLLFGYFLKIDAAWNIKKDFHWYISIGTDF